MRINRTHFSWALALVALVGGWLGGASPATADTWGRHPHYIHALSDLRQARWLLNRPDEWNVTHHEQDAVRRINEAINDITQAAIDDGKNLNATFPADANLDVSGRFHQARALLNSALQDLSYKEDDPAALGWRAGAIRHVEQALDQVNRAARDKHWDWVNGQ